MALYRYEAVNLSGETVKGEMEAPHTGAVVAHLHRQGYLPVAAEQKSQSWLARLSSRHLDAPRLPMRDVVHLTQELASMLQAGLPLERALGLLAKLANKPKLAAFLKGVLGRVRTGAGLADALAASEAKLPNAYIGMVRAGEAGGGKVLEATLDRLADHLGKEQAVTEGISSALVYPLILLVMAGLSIVFMLLFVLPQFEPLFESAGAALPLSTQIVLAAARGLRDYGLILLLLAALAVYGLHRAMRRDDVKHWRDTRLLALPSIGPAIAKAEVARFCRTLGALQASGVSLAAGVAIAAEGLGNSAVASAMAKSVQKVREGESLSASLPREKLIPALALQMIRIGEETGHLDAMLLKIADIYDRDVQRSIERAMVLLAPILTIILGAIIATIIGSVLSAILGVNDLIA